MPVCRDTLNMPPLPVAEYPVHTSAHAQSELPVRPSPLQRLSSFRSEARVAVVRRGRSLEDLARRVQRHLRARSLVRELADAAPALRASAGSYTPLPDSVFQDPAELARRLPADPGGGVQVVAPSPVPAPRTSLRGKASVTSRSSCESGCGAPPESGSLNSADSGVYSETELSEVSLQKPLPAPRTFRRTKRKRERYEVCLGYLCKTLEADDCSISVYSLQRNKSALRELVRTPPPSLVTSDRRGE